MGSFVSVEVTPKPLEQTLPEEEDVALERLLGGLRVAMATQMNIKNLR